MRRDLTPTLPVAEGTTTDCDFWYDNDGSIDCDFVPDFYGCTLDDFFRWVSFRLVLLDGTPLSNTCVEPIPQRVLRKLPRGSVLLCRGPSCPCFHHLKAPGAYHHKGNKHNVQGL